jgi:Na+/melibiose symporter-like transporter
MNFASDDPSKLKRDGLSSRHIYAYMVGHFNNDLCASMWFIYLTYFLTYVVVLPSNIVALALLSGQITDGITTPIVGMLSDKANCPCGKRNTWFYLGSILVIPAFSGIFLQPNFFSGDNGATA